jgi:sec-independent protein translocase protein TatA
MGIWELLVIGLIVLILFGNNKLPSLGRGLGKAIKGFRDSVQERKDNDPHK